MFWNSKPKETTVPDTLPEIDNVGPYEKAREEAAVAFFRATKRLAERAADAPAEEAITLIEAANVAWSDAMGNEEPAE